MAVTPLPAVRCLLQAPGGHLAEGGVPGRVPALSRRVVSLAETISFSRALDPLTFDLRGTCTGARGGKPYAFTKGLSNDWWLPKTKLMPVPTEDTAA